MAWIRNQDKKDLSNCETVWIVKTSTGGFNLKSLVRNYGFTLGEFPTEEAALAELDAIERWIAEGPTGVYQIPSKELS